MTEAIRTFLTEPKERSQDQRNKDSTYATFELYTDSGTRVDFASREYGGGTQPELEVALSDAVSLSVCIICKFHVQLISF